MNAEISVPFVEDPELWKEALSFKPGVDQNTALHACPTAGPAFLIFPLSLQDYYLIREIHMWLTLTTSQYTITHIVSYKTQRTVIIFYILNKHTYCIL